LEALAQFLGGYFHQDFMLDHESWQGVVAQFRADASPAELARVQAELDQLINRQLGEDQLSEALLDLGCFLLPVSFSFAEWLEQLRSELAAA
jgi:hypothetical protein